MEPNTNTASGNLRLVDAPNNPLDSRVGLALAFWAYPQKDIEAAKKVINYPEFWVHAEPGVHLPAGWPKAQFDADGKLLQQGWNTQHSERGALENQFNISINRETRQITFDFKGSDASSNWVSDFANAGASEFSKIQGQAQTAFDQLRQDERYKDFEISALGHSLGGGMAQSFALKNNLDAYVYNSLPIARDTRSSDYFDSAGGYEQAVERYAASGRKVHDVRTPNDIATYAYDGVMGNHYLSHHTGQQATMLPGTAMPDLLKTALMASKAGTLPATYLMGKDHTMGAMANTQQGLGLSEEGRYTLPEGQGDFASVPYEARKRFALLSASPVVKVFQQKVGEGDSPDNQYMVHRADGSQQLLVNNPRTGDVDIHHYGTNGERTHIHLNELRKKGATFTELDFDGKTIRKEQVALHEEPPAQHGADLQTASARPVLSPEQKSQLEQAYAQMAPGLQRHGMTEQEAARVCSATLAHCARNAHLGGPERFLVSKTGDRVAVLHEGQQLSEMPIREAMGKDVQGHLAEAVSVQAQQASTHAREGQQMQAPVMARG